MRDFLENRPTLLTLDKAHMEPATNAPLIRSKHLLTSGEDKATPNIEVTKDSEGQVREIIVTCHCGERIVLQCTY